MQEKFQLYNHLSQYGNVYSLKLYLKDSKSFVDWTEENFKYVKYNPRKKVDREGLSITSLDGGVSGVPDLDSLYEYNFENNTSYTELDFKVPTPVFEHAGLQKTVGVLKNYMFRTHILKLNPGGFFPPHRDLVSNFDSFRIIVPLLNVNPPYVNFVVDGVMQHWEEGVMYFVDTAKLHYLFNSSFSPSYWIVLNVQTTPESVDTVLKHINF